MKKLLCFLSVVLFLLTGSLNASAPLLINYQGTLTTNTGDPVADDFYSLTFTIYDSPTGGISKWSEIRSVETKNGQFSLYLGMVDAIEDTVFREAPRYLGIRVRTDPEVLPRAMLVTAPWAFRTSTIDGTRGGSVDGSIIITPTTFDSLGNAITVQDALGRTTMTVTVKADNVAAVDFYDPVDSKIGPNAITPFRLRLDKDGMTFFGTDSSDTSFHIAADGDVQSVGAQNFTGPITIGGNGTDGSLTLINAFGAIGPRLDTAGIIFGDGSTQYTASVPSGVAQAVEGVFSTSLTDSSGRTTILRHTLFCPKSGYVWVTGTCQPIYSHVNGTTTAADFGISEDSLTWDNDQDHSWQLYSAMPTGTYTNVISMTKIFPVTYGTNSFFLLGDKVLGTNNPTVYDATLSLVFIPNSYGIVNQSISQNDNDEYQFLTNTLPGDKSSDFTDRDISLRALQVRIDDLEARLNDLLRAKK